MIWSYEFCTGKFAYLSDGMAFGKTRQDFSGHDFPSGKMSGGNVG